MVSKIFIAGIIEKLYSKYQILAILGEASITTSEKNEDFAYLALKPSLIIKKEEIEYFFKSLDDVLSEGVNKINFDFIKQIIKNKIGIN